MRETERDWDEPEFKKEKPQPLHEFRGVDRSDTIHLPELASNRKRTNTYFCIFFLVFIVLWVGFTIYIVTTANIQHFIHGEDDCGNVCGLKNVEVKRTDNCEPKDYTNYPVLFYHTSSEKRRKQCITAAECNNTMTMVFRKCSHFYFTIPGYYLYYLLDGIVKGYLGYLGMAAIATGFCIIILLCLWCNVRMTLLILLISSSIALIAALIFIGYTALSRSDNIENMGTYYELGSLCLGLLLFLVGTACALCHRFRLICLMYEETMLAIFNAPILLMVPLLISLILIVMQGVTLYMIMTSYSGIENISENEWNTRLAYLVILGIFMVWIFAFVNGFQCMIVAGTVATYYFARDKSAVHHAFLSNVLITIRFHLGTIAAGSLIVTIMRIIEALAEGLEDAERKADNILVLCLICCLQLIVFCLREIVEYLTKKAYMMTAIHGKGLFASGKRAVLLLWHFVFDTISVDIMGYTLMHFISLIVLFFAVMTGYGIGIAMNVDQGILLLYLLLGIILSGTITFFYAALLNVAVETTFLCFCEDRLLNDGSSSRPYFASKSLVEFLDAAYEASESKRNKRRRKREIHHNPSI